MIEGVIIAGGTSSRFGDGRDKALANVAGVPMIRRVADALVPVVDRLLVNACPRQVDAFESALSDVGQTLTFAVDQQPKRGPVAGLETALTVTDGDSVLALACDLPLLGPSTLSALHARLERTESAEPNVAGPLPDCVLLIVDSKRQPLCGAYAFDELSTAIGALNETRHSSFDAVLSQLNVVTVSSKRLPRGSQVFLNVNTPTDLKTAENALRTNDHWYHV